MYLRTKSTERRDALYALSHGRLVWREGILDDIAVHCANYIQRDAVDITMEAYADGEMYVSPQWIGAPLGQTFILKNQSENN